MLDAASPFPPRAEHPAQLNGRSCSSRGAVSFYFGLKTWASAFPLFRLKNLAPQWAGFLADGGSAVQLLGLRVDGVRLVSLWCSGCSAAA